MKFSILPMISSAMAVSISYDPVYGNPGQSMNTVACSNGKFGLAAKYPTLGDLPAFPNVGGIPDIPDWNNDQNCGTCWKVTVPNRNPIFILGVDSGKGNFNVSPQAFTELTGSTDAGRVNDIQYEKVSADNCKMPVA
uniref:Cerato-populin n=2 Tax=Ceratocystis harringtonii TaxID=312341 RepID=A4KTQ9_9PEZI|nr:cerato-populin [Ceratocystis harringtonii]